MKQRILGGLVALAFVFSLVPAAAAETDGTFDEIEILKAATDFFGDTTEGVAKVIRKVFEELGRPSGFITGEEISGAFFVGLRYGNGTLERKTTATTTTTTTVPPRSTGRGPRWASTSAATHRRCSPWSIASTDRQRTCSSDSPASMVRSISSPASA